MALIQQYSDDNKQEYEPTVTVQQSLGFFTDAWLIPYEIIQTTTTGRYSYVGMTRAAAMACQAEVNDPENGIIARVFWVAGSMYDVEVTVYKQETIRIQVPTQE